MALYHKITYLIFVSQLALVLVSRAAVDASKSLIGVHPDQIKYYQPDSEHFFTCLDGSARISYDSVNDDYCDCKDASDEPGTAACFHGQFFCKNGGYIQKLIPSAWVNDGQCDCCDTSDEYNSTAKCQNTCGELGEVYRQEQQLRLDIADKGSAIRSQYKQEAKQRKEQNSELLQQYKRELSEKENAIKRLEEELNADFGPSNVFLPLKDKCFTFKDREYTYSLCMFDRATQESSGMHTELGRWAGWTGPSEDLHSKQRYEGGTQCWNGPARATVVNIICGVEDKITSVTEPSKCEYVYEFTSPAACPDTDPPEAVPDDVNIDHEAAIEAGHEVEGGGLPDQDVESPDHSDGTSDSEFGNLPTPPSSSDGDTHDEL